MEGVPEFVKLGKDNRSAYEDLVKRRELLRVDRKSKYSGKQGLQAVQDLDVLGSKGLLLLSTLIKVSRQGISSSVSLALIIIDLKVVTREFPSLTDLSGAQTLCVHELSKFIMVGKHEDFMLRAFWLVLLSLERLNNG